MGAIVDTLYANEDEISLIVKQYPDCHLEMKNPLHSIEKYTVVIPDEIEERYYDFLIENNIPMSSANFLKRLNEDVLFAEKVL